MLRLLIKLILSPFAFITFLCNGWVSLMLWDKRGMDDAGRLFKVIWSDNEPFDLDV
tara:strand:+ start:1094 stop:1261 length:168 start_codon:yes stop_codon:yes gene_type:complete